MRCHRTALVGLVAAVVLAWAAAPSALGADPEPTPTQGEIVIDPTFITDASPTGIVAGATGRPRVTPPPTDALAPRGTPGTSLPVLLVVLAGTSLFTLVVREPGTGRR